MWYNLKYFVTKAVTIYENMVRVAVYLSKYFLRPLVWHYVLELIQKSPFRLSDTTRRQDEETAHLQWQWRSLLTIHSCPALILRVWWLCSQTTLWSSSCESFVVCPITRCEINHANMRKPRANGNEVYNSTGWVPMRNENIKYTYRHPAVYI